MSRFISESLKELSAYVPGEQPKDLKYIKLNTNESPYPPSKRTIRALGAKRAKRLNLYPDPTCSGLKKVLAKRYDAKEENIFVSNGSDDILNFAFMAFGKDNGAIFPDITYGFYEVFCELYNIDYKKIPLAEDFSIKKEEYVKDAGLIAIANPNAPTGMILSVDDIEEIVKVNQDAIVLVDEAYIDFGGESAVSLTKKYQNVMICRTFSKSRNMAGARLGFAIADKAIIEDLEKIKYSTNPYSINSMSLIAGIKAVESDDYYAKKCKKIIKAREYTEKELLKLGFTMTNSSANFIFAKSDRISGKEFYEKLRKNGILVRHFDKERIKDYNRITIGTQKQMESFISVTQKILKETEK